MNQSNPSTRLPGLLGDALTYEILQLQKKIKKTNTIAREA